MTQHPDHACALALIDAGCGWAAIAILEASKHPASAAALRFMKAGRLDLALAEIKAGETPAKTPTHSTRAGGPGATEERAA